MNIALRPSGGRGEYELAGRQGEVTIKHLFGLPMFIEILPGVTINAHSNCILKDGKPRIRLTPITRYAHPASLITAAMMLPRPRRERDQTHGMNLLQWQQFVVQTVRIDVALRTNSVLLCPITVRLENGDDRRIDVSFAERMARVMRVWMAAAVKTSPIAVAVQTHAHAFTSAFSTQNDLIHAFNGLYVTLGKPAGDMLPILESQFALGPLNAPSIGDLSAKIADEDFAEEVHVNPAAARIDRVRKWRLATIRGGSALKFRKKVREAYDSRCLFSGQKLPRTEATSTAGVDAAHILPWSRYDLDAAKNGLCLNKQCHWAFDEGLFRLTFDEAEHIYVISIPSPVRLAAANAHFDIASFDAIVGPIPRERLPTNENLWPSSQYLQELNDFLDDEAA